MGDPVTMAIVAGAMSVAQGVQGMQQNNAMAKAAQRQTDANIINEKNRLAADQIKLQRSQELARGKQTVAAAGSGATLGSFDTLFADNANQSLMDKYMMDYDSKMTQENIRYSGAVKKQEYKSAAKSSLISGVTNAAMGFATSGVGTGTSPSGSTLSNKLFNSSYFNTTTQSGLNSYAKATAGL